MSRPAQAAPQKRQQVRCWNGFDGCGRMLDIIKVHKDTQQIEAENFHPGARLCLPCCNKLAYDWKISFEDVDMLGTAKQSAKAGKMGAEGTKEEINAILTRLGVKRTTRQSWTRAADSVVPTGDRA